MPISKTKMKNAAIAAKSAVLSKISKELLDQFVSGPMAGEAVICVTSGAMGSSGMRHLSQLHNLI